MQDTLSPSSTLTGPSSKIMLRKIVSLLKKNGGGWRTGGGGGQADQGKHILGLKQQGLECVRDFQQTLLSMRFDRQLFETKTSLGL